MIDTTTAVGSRSFDQLAPAAYIPLGISRDIHRRLAVRTADAADSDRHFGMEDQSPQSSDSENVSLPSAAALRDLERRAQEALAASWEHNSRLEAEIIHQLDQIAATLQAQTAAENQDATELANARAEIERLQAELEQSHNDTDAERATLETSREELTQHVARLETEQRAVKEEWQKQLAEFEQKLAGQQSAWNEQRAAWSQEREGLEASARELRQKFELALEDVQRFRGRIAELEQELARRPETNEADSAEIVALRAERDALSERVEQLERQPPAPVDASSEQQMADLQRRFELAVEDVRELKTKNAQLEAQLASAGKKTAASGDSGGMDWESQKRRLLASLEDEGEEHHEPARQRERLTIENTIEMTDAIVAGKDNEIAELKLQLAGSGNAAGGVAAGGNAASGRADEERNQKIADLVDADDVIAEHRKRVAQLEREMQDKLRTAELELSVERAKMARQKAELEDLRADIESQRNAYGGNGPNPGSGVPRRRWLSKLGLSGEEP
jgi:chromosome segregation ATPase